MKHHPLPRRATAFLLCITLLLTLLPAYATDTSGTFYFQRQLLTQDARTIYDVIDEMDLASGVETVTLSGVQTANWDTLFADFVAARDAYMLDHNLFYVNFDKMTLTQEGDKVTMGLGRADTYFADGFDATNVAEAVAAFNAKAKAIATAAKEKTTLQAQVRAAFDGVIEATVYRLETDPEVKNPLYVRNAYGALVKGEAVCEGYARALKTVLDAMGIENVLVQGMFVDDDQLQPHMWNCVRMDDNRWYMLDATMGDAAADASDFFLVTGLDPVMEDYQPNGVVSLSNKSMEFGYPDLSIKAYEPLSDSFAATGEGTAQTISYNGKGVKKAQAPTTEGADDGIYILASFDGKGWYYFERYLQWALIVAGGGNDNITDPSLVDITSVGFDYDTYFTNSFQFAYFAVTNIKPTPAEEIQNKLANDYFIFTGGLENIHEISAVSEAITLQAIPPYILKKEARKVGAAPDTAPYTSRLDQGATYDVTVTYSEPLKSVQSTTQGLIWVDEIDGAAISDFNWDGNSTITFKLSTVKRFGRTTSYFLELTGLVGQTSNKAPNAIGFSTYNYNVYDCPKVDWDVNKIHSNTPALIANEDLSTDGWKDANGNEFSSDLPKRLSLVASTVSTAQAESMETAIASKSGQEVLASQTYDISLSLCSAQVAYISGDPVQVYVPFPEGYNYERYVSGEASFKAYHFSNGVPELIPCDVVPGGIIMYCSKFSPFAVVAVDAESGGGDVTPPEHTHVLTKIDAVDATCIATGNIAYWTCECGKYFSDAAGTTEIDKDAWVIARDPANHASVGFTCTDNGDGTHTVAHACCKAVVATAAHGYVERKCVCGAAEPLEPFFPTTPTTPSTPSTPSTPVVPALTILSFGDVPASHWGYDYILKATQRGLINGVEANRFAPELSATRAQVVTVLARSQGVETNGNALIKGMAWAVANGISDGSDPDGIITREQLVTMLYRKAGSPAVYGSLSGFSDAGSVSSWAADAMTWAVRNGVINGMTPTTLVPGGSVTRVQMAAILIRFLDRT